MKTYQIHFITAGQSDEMLKGNYIGHTDTPLSKQSKIDMLLLKDLYTYPEVEAVFSSPLLRSIETAKLIYSELEPLVINGLIEYNFGEFENQSAEDLQDDPIFKEWLSGMPNVKPPFGESNEQFSQRITETIMLLIEGVINAKIGHTAIVTHGGIIMAVMAAFGLPKASMHEWRTQPGAGYTVRITPELWMSGQKFEVIAQIPYEKKEDDNENSYGYWNIDIE